LSVILGLLVLLVLLGLLGLIALGDLAAAPPLSLMGSEKDTCLHEAEAEAEAADPLDDPRMPARTSLRAACLRCGPGKQTIPATSWFAI